MSEYKPGTVAVATVLGAPGVRVSRYDGGWARLDDPGIFYSDENGVALGMVTDVRPLVVLDPEDHNQINDLVQRSEYFRPGAIVTGLTKAIQRGLRSLAPRIPEPGLWGVVEASVEGWTDGPSRFVNFGGSWIAKSLFGTKHASWSDLIDPVEIRKGVA